MANLEDMSPAEQQQLRLGKLLLETNPDIAMDAKRLAKKADPKLRLPEVELEDKLAAERAERAKLEEKIERQRIEDRVAERERAARSQIEDAGFTVEEIEKIVKDEGSGISIATALKLATLQRESAVPGAADFRGGPTTGPVEMRPEKEWRSLSVSDMRKKSADIMREGINDILRRQRAAR